ncbi:hypothetical protein M6B38_102410 [Iris pallida]|uniref:Uncharacterized protein n=1 Tax=Iris pallida TaxID=29817 RepID=A0AAX6IPE1_IRIPA|nr:hypothetical protein M6B38_327330 [Iris pallida]KAJ6854313.1 hypothetical protein M6B38_102410 [Iris pallida]
MYSPQPVTWTRLFQYCAHHVWYYRIIVSFLYFTCSCTLHSCTIDPVLIFCITFMYIPVYLFMYPCTHFISCSCFIT